MQTRVIPEKFAEQLFRLGRPPLLCTDSCKVHLCHVKLIVNAEGLAVSGFCLRKITGIGIHDTQVKQPSGEVGIVKIDLPVFIQRGPPRFAGSRTQLILPHLGEPDGSLCPYPPDRIIQQRHHQLLI